MCWCPSTLRPKHLSRPPGAPGGFSATLITMTVSTRWTSSSCVASSSQRRTHSTKRCRLHRTARPGASSLPDSRELLFQFGRCVAHFAVDDHVVKFCTHLTGKDSWFLPFDRGWDDGAGNPPNPDGLKTDYLWKRILTREGLTDILENYAQVVEIKDARTGRKKALQIWPRFHQVDVVRKLLADAGRHGAGRRYLIQHS